MLVKRSSFLCVCVLICIYNHCHIFVWDVHSYIFLVCHTLRFSYDDGPVEEKMHVNVTQPMTLCLRVWEPSLAGVSTRCFPLFTFMQCASHAVCVKRRKTPVYLGAAEFYFFSIIFRVFLRPAGHDITILLDRS